MQSPIGTLEIEVTDECLSRLALVHKVLPNQTCTAQTELEQLIYEQLTSYFDNPKYQFSIPLTLPDKTPFRRRVWKALCKIKVGSTVTYGELAKALHSHPRAIGGACRINPIPIIIPCHRVVAKSGHLCGYRGAEGQQDLDTKAWLLRHEQVVINYK